MRFVSGGWCVVYVVARELCLVCASWMDPCLCSELLWCIPLHLCSGAKSCLLPRVGSCVAYLKKRNSVRIVCLYSPRHLVALGEPQSISRVPCCPLTLPCRWHCPRAVMLVLSDSEPCAGTRGLRPPFSRQAFVARCGLQPRLRLTVPALSVGLMQRRRRKKGMLPG